MGLYLQCFGEQCHQAENDGHADVRRNVLLILLDKVVNSTRFKIGVG